MDDGPLLLWINIFDTCIEGIRKMEQRQQRVHCSLVIRISAICGKPELYAIKQLRM